MAPHRPGAYRFRKKQMTSSDTPSFTCRLTQLATADVRLYLVAQKLLVPPVPATEIHQERWGFCGRAVRRLLPADRSYSRRCHGTKYNNQP